MHRRTPALLALAALALALPLAPASAQDAPPPPPRRGGIAPPSPGTGGPTSPPEGAAREAMWRAATAEEWKRPVLITFQRTWEDALAVAKEENRPILVCVNMDGEIASEHYAGVRYREPEIAALYRPYVCVIASVYRHNPRDFDDAGNRILCPRFGSVTCGEHIAIEPVLYEKFFEGVRVAPRHLLIELDQKETFDVYYAMDTATVFGHIRRGVEGRPEPRTVVRGDRPAVERVGSREVSDRTAVERAYAEGDAETRRALLEAAAKNPGAAPLDLLRLALFGLDPELASAARRSLAAAETPESLGLISDALRAPMAPADRDALLGALDRLAEKSPKARWLSVVHRGVAGKSEIVDVQRWKEAGATYPAPDAGAAGAADGEDDGAANLARAERFLAEGLEARQETGPHRRAGETFSRLLLIDARRAALRAEEKGATSWRTSAVLSIAAWNSGELEEAYARSALAVKALPPGEASVNAWRVLTIFAEGRWKSIKAAVREKRRWPPEWLTDLNAAFTVLRRHPLGTDAQVAWHAELLSWLGFEDRAGEVVEEGLKRFGASEALHDRIRRRILEKESPARLEAIYAEMMAREERPEGIERFAARASVAAGDALRMERRPAEAAEAYGRAVALYDRALEADPSARAECDRGAALALAARARIAFSLDDDGKALEEILASFERDPLAAGDRDGAGITPGETAQVLQNRLRERKKEEELKRLETAMAGIDPELLRYDR